MKSFFLIFLLLYLSFFPSTSPSPLVEIIEEELVVHNAETIIPKIFIPERKVVQEFPLHLTLSPQHHPDPVQRPPAHS